MILLWGSRRRCCPVAAGDDGPWRSFAPIYAEQQVGGGKESGSSAEIAFKDKTVPSAAKEDRKKDRFFCS